MTIEYPHYERIASDDERNPYVIDMLVQSSDDGYLRIQPPVQNLDGFFEWDATSFSAEFSMEQITQESTIVHLDYCGGSYDTETSHIEETRSAAKRLLGRLGAGAHVELFKKMR